MSNHDELIARAEQIQEGVTPGQWEVNREGWACISSGPDSVLHAYVETTCIECDAEIVQSMDCRVALSIEDAEFIAAARTLLPELVSALKEAQATNERLCAELEQLRDGCVGEPCRNPNHYEVRS